MRDRAGHPLLKDNKAFAEARKNYEEKNKEFLLKYGDWQNTISNWLKEPLDIMIVQMPFDKFPTFYIDAKFLEVFSSDFETLM